MITTKQLKENVLVHNRGGNGYVMVQDLDKEYCKIATISKDSIDNRAFLAYKKMLSVEQTRSFTPGKPVGPECDVLIPEEIRPAVDELRIAIKEGKTTIESIYIENAPKPH